MPTHTYHLAALDALRNTIGTNDGAVTRFVCASCCEACAGPPICIVVVARGSYSNCPLRPLEMTSLSLTTPITSAYQA